MKIKNTNDGSLDAPYLRVDINYNTCDELPTFSSGPKGNDLQKHTAIADAGFSAIQDGIPDLCNKLNLNLTAHARVNAVGDLKEVLPLWKSEGYNCATVHLGWGLESDSEVNGLVEYILDSSVNYDFPIYIETHRATVTQDMFRTVALTKRFPEIRFNGDFSHWYTGQEMIYGGIEQKWNFLEPVFDRVRFLHGRIGNPGSIQVAIQNNLNTDYVAHFKEMWTRSFLGFLKYAEPGDYISFTVELLKSTIFYARKITDENGLEREEGDRWEEALLYKTIADECWAEAQNRYANLQLH